MAETLATLPEGVTVIDMLVFRDTVYVALSTGVYFIDAFNQLRLLEFAK